MLYFVDLGRLQLYFAVVFELLEAYRAHWAGAAGILTALGVHWAGILTALGVHWAGILTALVVIVVVLLPVLVPLVVLVPLELGTSEE